MNFVVVLSIVDRLFCIGVSRVFNIIDCRLLC